MSITAMNRQITNCAVKILSDQVSKLMSTHENKKAILRDDDEAR